MTGALAARLVARVQVGKGGPHPGEMLRPVPQGGQLGRLDLQAPPELEKFQDRLLGGLDLVQAQPQRLLAIDEQPEASPASTIPSAFR